MSMFPGNPGVTAPTDIVEEAVADEKQIRSMSVDEKHHGVLQRQWGFQARLDPRVTFEEFTYWAKVEREMEAEEKRREIKDGKAGMFSFLQFKKKKEHNDSPAALPAYDEATGGEKGDIVAANGPLAIGPASTHDYDAEWRQASRALRTASWGGVFYLITTDILGWGQTPYVFANLGYNYGIGMFVLMGFCAGFAGLMIWKVFCALDSSRYPMVTFGDPYFRLFGPFWRHFMNVMQAIQMLLTVCVLLLGQTNIIAQLGENTNVCFVAFAVINLVVSMAGGFMRSLKHVGWFANAAVWINVVSFIIICVAAAKFGPDPSFASLTGLFPHSWATDPVPVKTFFEVPPLMYQPTNPDPFGQKFSGIDSIVYAYSGAVFFIAFLSEMKQPMDFWKAMFLAQTFIAVIYIFFGVFAYTYYGQYSYSTINNVVKPLSLQILSNVFALVTGWIATFLYFNLGMKTVYIEVGQEICGLPPITTKKGHILWQLLGPVYWLIGFVISMSIPEFNAFTGFVGGLFALNFTYSFGAIMYVGYQVQEGARLEGEGFDPTTGITVRHDNGWKRWSRGFVKNWKFVIPALAFACAGLAASGMGTWSAIISLEAAFSNSVQTSWTCVNPAKG